MPIDLASGAVERELTDVEIPGEVDLTWERRYSTTLVERPISPIGLAWTCRYFASLIRRPDGFEFVTAEGTAQTFADADGAVDQGRVVRDLGAFREIFRQGSRYIVQQWDVETDVVVRYCFPIDRSGALSRLASIEDETGQGLDLSWDNRGRLVELRQRVEGRSLLFTYSPPGLIERIVLRARNHPERMLVRYEHDSAQRLVAAFDAAEIADRYEYDARGRLTREINKDGGVFTYRYDEHDRCVRMAGLDGYQNRRLRYLDAVRLTEVTDSYGHTFRYEHLPTGQIIRAIDPLGRERTTEYDADGRVVAIVTAAGHATRFTYDEAGNRSTIVDPLGAARAFTYNRHHLPVTMLDPLGRLWRHEFDESFRLTRAIDPLGGRWSVRYNADGTVAEMFNALGARKTWEYDEGVVRTASDWFGNTTSFRFDAMGQIVEMIEPLNLRTSYEFDAVGNVLVVRLADGTERRRAYDVAGNVTAIVDGTGNVVTFRYGSCRRLLERVDAMGRTVRYQWGTEPDRLVSVENEKGERYTFEYDVAGRLVREHDFDGVPTTYEYDLDDNVAAMVVGEHRTVLARDAAGRLVTKAAGGATSEYSYNANGELIAARNANANLRFEYDATGSLIREVQRLQVEAGGLTERADFQLDYRLDAVSGRVETILPSGDVLTMHRDGGGQWVDTGWNGATMASVQRDAMRRQIGRTFGNPEEPGLTHRREYDPVSQVVSTQLDSRARVLARSDFTYDAEGRLTTRQDRTRGTFAYQYDRSSRLEGSDQPGLSERFRFDPAGNLIDDRPGPDAAPGNRLQRYKNLTLEYDEQGNPIQIAGAVEAERPPAIDLQYDAENQLIRAASPPTMEAAYYYDPFGRRVAKAVATRGQPAALTFFSWDGDALLQEVTPRETITYLREPDSFVPLAQIHSDIPRSHYASSDGEDGDGRRPKHWSGLERIYFLNNDHLGTPQEAVTPAGIVSWLAYYRAWGRLRTVANREVTQPFRFQGQYEDVETGFFYNRYRYYDPDTARYLTKDPIGFAGFDKNFYRYAINPTGWIDPRGLTGTYVFEHADGSKYVGKGPEERMEASIKQREAETGSPVIAKAHSDFGDDKTGDERKAASKKGFMTEHELMALEKFGETDSKLLNEIASPGKTREKTPAETAAAKRAAKALQRKLEADKKKKAAEAKKAKGKGC